MEKRGEYRQATLELAKKRIKAEIDEGLIEKMNLPIFLLTRLELEDIEVDEKTVEFFDDCRILVKDSEKLLDKWTEEKDYE
jgi:hypothetical protein